MNITNMNIISLIFDQSSKLNCHFECKRACPQVWFCYYLHLFGCQMGINKTWLHLLARVQGF
jgi:hypothetical protein